MTFRTALRRIVVGMVRRPWRIAWVVAVATGDTWLQDHWSEHGLTGTIVSFLIRLAAILLMSPVIVAAINDGDRPRST
jgi:hypothetical protein